MSPRKRIPKPMNLFIEKAMWDKKYSRMRLSEESWVPYQTIVKIENWETDNPNLKNITKIARVLDLSLDEITRDMYFDND